VTAVLLPEGVNELQLRRSLLATYDIEVSGGIGKLAGRMLRIGLMGYNSTRKNVTTVLTALERLLPAAGHEPTPGAALAAADAVYEGKH